MAGAGYKLFATGDVLSASDVNLYLQQQTVMVFASAAARTTALASVLAEGMVTYLKDTDVVEIYTGAAWVSLDDPNAIQNSLLTAKGSIVTATGASTPSALAVGTANQVLTVDSTTATGLKWATPSSSSPTFVGCSIYNSATFSLTNNTNTLLTMNSEFFDSNAFHDTTTNTARITITTGYGGKYLVALAGKWEANSTGWRAVELYKNNASLLSMIQIPGNGTINAYNRASIIVSLAAGDYLELYGWQNSGSTLSGYFREYEYPIQVTWLGA